MGRVNAMRQLPPTLWADCRRVPETLLAIYTVIWVITAVRPSDRQTWLFENLLVFAVLPALFLTYKKFQFSNLSYGLIGVFLALHAWARTTRIRRCRWETGFAMTGNLREIIMTGLCISSLAC